MISFLRKIERSCAVALMRLMFAESKVAIEGEKSFDQNSPYIISPLNLIESIRMVLNPIFWGPELYCRKKWKLLKGDLSNFIADCIENVPSGYGIYFKFQEQKITFSHFIKQRLLTIYYTRKVKGHYNIDPEIYQFFLDEEMVYTCAFFEENSSLEEAQSIKFKKIFERAELPRKPKILNIGCGWGSLERYFVKNFEHGNIVGLSLSSIQVKWANNKNYTQLRSDDNDRINLRVEDYRIHKPLEKYDSIISIGMVEHVGQSGYAEYFQKCYDMLKTGGSIVVHMMVYSKSNVPTNSWIDKFIFPGGYIPSISEITKGAELEHLRLNNIYIHEPINYKKTIWCWRKKLSKNRENIIDIYVNKYNYSNEYAEYLYLQWYFYLSASEAKFMMRKESLQVVHLCFKKLEKFNVTKI